MDTVTIRELELNLNLILKQVEAGKHIKVLDKDKNVVAILVPPKWYEDVAKKLNKMKG